MRENQFVFMVHVGKITNLVKDCVASLRNNNPNCSINLFTIPEQSPGLKSLEGLNVNTFMLKPEQWNDRMMTCKIEKFRDFLKSEYVSIPEDSQVIISDTDIVFQNDPFIVFKNSFDLFYTTRNYEYKYTINAGFWGVRKNLKTVSFLQNFAEEIVSPSWPEFINFRKKEKRKPPPRSENYINWWSDQDYLCTMHDHGVPPGSESLKVFDAGPKFNYCPTTDGSGGVNPAILDMESKMNDPDYVVLHFKGKILKQWYSDRKKKGEQQEMSNKETLNPYLTEEKAVGYRQHDDEPYDLYALNFGERITKICESYDNEINILDLACGTGRYFHRLNKVKQLHGVDFSQPMLQKAQKPTRIDEVEWWKQREEKVTFFHTPASEFCKIVPDNRYDFIYSIGAIAEYKYPDGITATAELFSDIARILAPNGTFLFTVHEKNFSSSKIKKFLSNTDMKDFHIQVEDVSFKTWKHSLVTVVNKEAENTEQKKDLSLWQKILKKF